MSSRKKYRNLWYRKDRNRYYYRYTENGRRYHIPLPHIDHPDFEAAYQRAVDVRQASEDTPDRGAPVPGTFLALTTEYRRSSEFKNLAPSTRRVKSIYIDRIERSFGHRFADEMRAGDVDKILDQMSERPGTLRAFRSALKGLMNFAIMRGYILTNPVTPTKPLALGEHQPWPDELIGKAVENAYPMLALTIITCLFTGQRIGDCIRIRHDDIDNGEFLEMHQQKTGAFVCVPIHPFWLEAIGRVPRRAETILYNKFGRPFEDPGSLQEGWRELRKKLGAESFKLHGLRKNATNHLASLGLSPHQIGAITGMTIETVAHYTKQIDRERLSRGIADRFRNSAPGGTRHHYR